MSKLRRKARNHHSNQIRRVRSLCLTCACSGERCGEEIPAKRRAKTVLDCTRKSSASKRSGVARSSCASWPWDDIFTLRFLNADSLLVGSPKMLSDNKNSWDVYFGIRAWSRASWKIKSRRSGFSGTLAKYVFHCVETCRRFSGLSQRYCSRWMNNKLLGRSSKTAD